MEAAFVEWLTQRLTGRTDIVLGVGDDAAVYGVVSGSGAERLVVNQVVTTDLLCEGVHFRWSDTTPEMVGRKALAVNLSDLAAMAAQPRAAVVSLLWPRDRHIELAKAMYEGMISLADQYRVAIIGGDTNTWDGSVVVSVTLFGDLTDRGPLTRQGANVNDAILVTGHLGGSLAGHHLTFTPRVNEALRLHRDFDLCAGMDITDGLSLDLDRLTKASGVGALLDLGTIPISTAAQQMSHRSDKTPLQHALSDGEDFELLLVTRPDVADDLLSKNPLAVPVTRIGTIIRQPGLWHTDSHGQLTALAVDGYLH